MTSLRQDLRYAWRVLRRSPVYAATAVLTLGLGIAANTTFFSVVNAVALKPIPGVDLDGLLVSTGADRPLGGAALRSLGDVLPEGIEAIGGSTTMLDRRVQIPGKVRERASEFVTGGYAQALRLPAQVGRWIGPEDDHPPAGEAVAVISDRLWREWFGGDRSILGRATLRVGGEPFTVIGVAAPGFGGLSSRFTPHDVWLPLSAFARVLNDRERSFYAKFYELYDTRGLNLIVRPSAGTPVAALEGTLQNLAPAQAPMAGRSAPRMRLMPAANMSAGQDLVRISLTVLALSGLLLVAACANLANMLYARGTERASEVAVRLALGATRASLVRLMLTEVTLIAAVAGALGVGLALAATRIFAEAFPFLLGGRFARFTLDLSPDVRVFGFALGVSLAAALLVGLLTSWRTTRVATASLVATSSGGGAAGSTRHGQRRRTVLVGVQVTIAVVLVMVAGLGHEQMRKTIGVEIGRRVNYDPSPLVAARIDLRFHGYDPSRAQAFFRQVLDDVRARPGIERAVIADALPGEQAHGTMFAAEDERATSLDPSRDPVVSGRLHVNGTYARVTPGFLDTLGVRLLEGRDFSYNDVDGAQLVAIITTKTAETFWPGESPIGKRLLLSPNQWMTVVGVAENLISAPPELLTRSSHFVLMPYAQHALPPFGLSALIVARTTTPAAIEGVQQAVRALDADVAILESGPVEDTLLAWLRPRQATVLLVSSLGALALGISMLGVYGVLAYFVTLRAREFGIRLALGARPRAIVKMVLDQAIHLVLIGLLAGVFISSVASRVIQSRVFDLMPNEISTWIVAPVLILVAGLAAGLLPAWRAAHVNPNRALRDL